MVNFHDAAMSFLLLTSVDLLQPSFAHCSNGEPTYPGFEFPSFSKDRACCETSDCDVNGALCASIGSIFADTGEIWLPTDETGKIEVLDDNTDDPDDDPFPIGGSFTDDSVDDVYGTDTTRFVHACEELYICNAYGEQYQEQRQGVDYEVRSLCFDRQYDKSSEQLRKERAARRSFVINTCHYGGNPNVAQLEEDRDAACDEAEILSKKLMFDASDVDNFESQDGRDDCLAAIACSKAETQRVLDELDVDLASQSDTISLDELYATDSEFAFENCYNRTDESLERFKNETCGTGLGGRPTVTRDAGIGGCESLPICPGEFSEYYLSFTPDYPVGSGYESFIKTIEGTVIKDGLDNRTNADSVGFLMATKWALQATLIAIEFFPKALPKSFPWVIVVAPKVTIEIIVQAMETVLAQADYQDALIDAAEIEAMYENTRQLYKSSAAIYDEVVCRCSGLDRPLRGLGCDSIDNDCDREVDELDEDNWPPEIDASDAIGNCGLLSGKSFDTVADAEACVVSYTTLEDDCDPDVTLDVSSEDSGSCGITVVKLNAEDANMNQAVEKLVQVLINGEVPVSSCNVGGSPRFLNPTGQGLLVDVGLTYSVTTTCNRPASVDVKVFSNELEDFQSQKMALLYRDSASENDSAGLYVASTVCTTAANGQCVKETAVPDARVYSVVVTATDTLGLESEPATCHIVVSSDTSFDVSSSNQLILLASYQNTIVPP